MSDLADKAGNDSATDSGLPAVCVHGSQQQVVKTEAGFDPIAGMHFLSCARDDSGGGFPLHCDHD